MSTGCGASTRTAGTRTGVSCGTAGASAIHHFGLYAGQPHVRRSPRTLVPKYCYTGIRLAHPGGLRAKARVSPTHSHRLDPDDVCAQIGLVGCALADDRRGPSSAPNGGSGAGATRGPATFSGRHGRVQAVADHRPFRLASYVAAGPALQTTVPGRQVSRPRNEKSGGQRARPLIMISSPDKGAVNTGLAGRSGKRLAAVRDSLGTTAQRWPLLAADPADPGARGRWRGWRARSRRPSGRAAGSGWPWPGRAPRPGPITRICPATNWVLSLRSARAPARRAAAASHSPRCTVER